MTIGGGAFELHPRELTGLSSTAGGRGVPLAGDRARPRRPPLGSRFWGWAGPLLIVAVASFFRLWRLGQPHDLSFDETYYAKHAWSLLHFGYVRGYVEKADDRILDGTTTGLWTADPENIVHPEVGKWLIALGEHFFGMNPFGWRVSAAIAGSLMVLVMCRLALRLTGSVLLACLAGVLLAFDGLHLVLSRLALLDIFMALFLLCGVHCVVADRSWFRARLARTSVAVPSMSGTTVTGLGPVRRLVFRPWLLAGGISFGLAIGTKWTALLPLAAFGLLVWAWSAGARRSFGVRRPWLASAVADGIPTFVQLVGVAALVYGVSWTGWLLHANEYERTLSDTQYTQYDGGDPWPTASEPDATGVGEVVQSLRSLAHYHRDAFVFHAHFLDDSSHTYGSKPRGWLLMNRPVGVNAETGIQPGEQGCRAPPGSDCLRQVLLIGTPVIWWVGALCLLYAILAWLGARDWRFGLCVVGVASTWLPWFRYDDRPIFIFYAIAILPFTILAITLTIGKLLGPAARPSSRRTVGVIVAGSFLVLVLINFAWFWPIWTDGLLTHDQWTDRIWFRRWI
ncbi:MAG: dolichyl-phosphate-mannose--protein mannosyltransferase [Nocardioides sp.]